jgi:hypothetical protein
MTLSPWNADKLDLAGAARLSRPAGPAPSSDRPADPAGQPGVHPAPDLRRRTGSHSAPRLGSRRTGSTETGLSGRTGLPRPPTALAARPRLPDTNRASGSGIPAAPRLPPPTRARPDPAKHPMADIRLSSPRLDHTVRHPASWTPSATRVLRTSLGRPEDHTSFLRAHIHALVSVYRSGSRFIYSCGSRRRLTRDSNERHRRISAVPVGVGGPPRRSLTTHATSRCHPTWTRRARSRPGPDPPAPRGQSGSRLNPGHRRAPRVIAAGHDGAPGRRRNRPSPVPETESPPRKGAAP